MHIQRLNNMHAILIYGPNVRIEANNLESVITAKQAAILLL